MGVFDKLGEAVGKAFMKIVDKIGEKGEWDDARITKFRDMLVKKSVKPGMFKSEEFKKFAVELEKRLSSSPEGLVDWLYQSYLDLMQLLYESVIAIIVPVKIRDFDTAKAEAGHLTFLAIDFVVLTAVLDVVATAASLTLVRNIAHIGAIFISTFGFDRYFQATIAPALESSMMPQLRYGYNEQFQAAIPPIQDVIKFTVREVYDPARRRELLSVPTPSEAYKFAVKHGFSNSIMDDYWASHWILPSIGELNTMLHRRKIDDATWARYMTLNDYEPMMIPRYKEIIYIPYSRVDTRRMYDTGALSEAQVNDNYLDLGYDVEHAKNMTDFAIQAVEIPKLKARYKNGYLTAEQLKAELIKIRVKPERLESILQSTIREEKNPYPTSDARGMYDFLLLSDAELYQNYRDQGFDDVKARRMTDWSRILISVNNLKERFTKGWMNAETFVSELMKLGIPVVRARLFVEEVSSAAKPARVAPERDLTKAEIIKGVKKGILTLAQGVELLVGMGYDEFEATYILAINLSAAAGSPESYEEFKNLVEQYKKAVTGGGKPLPAEVLALERERNQAKTALEDAKAKGKSDAEIAELALVLADKEKRLRDALKKVAEQGPKPI